MEAKHLTECSRENALVCQDRVHAQERAEPSEFVFLASLYVGSIGGAIAGCWITKFFLGGLFPIAFGVMGCMIGILVLCTLAEYFTSHSLSGPDTHHDRPDTSANDRLAR